MKRLLILFFTALLCSCSKETNENIPLLEAELFNTQRILKASITTRGEIDEESISSLISSIEKEKIEVTEITAVTSTKPNTTTKVNSTNKPITTTTTSVVTSKPNTTTIQTTTATSDFEYSNEALAILKLDNEKRAEVGKSALVLDESLTKAANARAKELVTKFSHTRPNGTNYSTILKDYGVTSKETSEIIAWGYNSPKDVVNGWMNSKVHKANILDSNNRGFTKVGIGYYNNGSKKYWVQIFGK